MNVWRARRIEGECVGWECTAPDGIVWTISKPHPSALWEGYWLSFCPYSRGRSGFQLMIGVANSNDISAVFHAYRLLAL